MIKESFLFNIAMLEKRLESLIQEAGRDTYLGRTIFNLYVVVQKWNDRLTYDDLRWIISFLRDCMSDLRVTRLSSPGNYAKTRYWFLCALHSAREALYDCPIAFVVVQHHPDIENAGCDGCGGHMGCACDDMSQNAEDNTPRRANQDINHPDNKALLDEFFSDLNDMIGGGQ